MSDIDKNNNKTNAPSSPPPKPVRGTWLDRLKDNASQILSPSHSSRMISPHPMVALFEIMYGRQVRLGATDAVVQMADGIATVATGMNGDKGADIADSVKDTLDRLRSYSDGKFEFRMAKGWKMPEGTRYNGKLPSDPGYAGPKPGQEIDGFWTIFHRNRSGSIEVLDKSDPQFSHIVGPYVMTQIGIAATVGTKGITSIRSVFAATNGVAGKAIAATTLPLASADVWGGITQVGQGLRHSLVLKPEAIERLGRIIDNPASLTPTQVMNELNVVLDQYSRKSGRRTEQLFIAPLTDPKEAILMLSQLSKGSIQAHVRQTPFAEILATSKAEAASVTEVHAQLKNDPYFQRSYCNLAIKALKGEKLNESEMMSLRFGMAIMIGEKDLPLVATAGDKTLDQRTIDSLRRNTSLPIMVERFMKVEADKRKEFEAMGLSGGSLNKRLDIEQRIWLQAPANIPTTTELIDVIKSRLSEADKKIADRQQTYRVQSPEEPTFAL